jgi:hypothetical protein
MPLACQFPAGCVSTRWLCVYPLAVCLPAGCVSTRWLYFSQLNSVPLVICVLLWWIIFPADNRHEQRDIPWQLKPFSIRNNYD